MAELRKCPKCGGDMPPDAVEGLCARCMARVVFGKAEVQGPKSEAEERGTIKVEVEGDMVVEPTGLRIGRYKLLEKIGEGGFGVVYMAEQIEPVVRRVALKIIKAGMDTLQVVARFEAERQALALMDHPNIARVLDAGTTERGRPYFVMELVKGIPITDYCDQYRLSPGDRLSLFIQVCHAVQHAHQKGIIHRDLKPSNVLVTLHDGEPVPKVIDFGVAKALGQKLTEKTLFTGFANMIGTPAYMSPEQAEISGLDVDTRSDVYALGVLLYELLTGTTPFEKETLAKAALDEIRRMIRETEPPKPSTRLTELARRQKTEGSGQWSVVSGQRWKEVRGDLDWIVMKCLEKDRTRRYETANSLALDIERHLDHQPVSAAAPSALYRARKFIRRHKAGLATAAGFALLLILAATVSTWEAILAARNAARATKHAQAELQQRQRAESLAEQNRQNLYASQINLAQQVYEQGDVARVIELLDSLRPVGGQPDLRGFEWYHLWRLCHSEERNLVGHEAPVRAVAFSPDGSLLASAGNDMVVRLWDTASGAARPEVGRHDSWISSLAFSPDGKLLASGGADRTVRLWDTAKMAAAARFEGFSKDVTCLAFSPGGEFLAAGTGEVATGAGTPFTRYARPVTNEEVRVWSIPGRQQIARILTHQGGVLSLALAPDAQTLATAGVDATVRIWQLSSEKERFCLTNFPGPVFAVAYSPDGTRLATASWYPRHSAGEVRFWEAQTLNEVPALKLRTPSVTCLAFCPDGQNLLTAGVDQTIRLWNLANGIERASFRGHTDVVWGLACAPDGHAFASASWDRSVRLWDVRRRRISQVLSPFPHYTACFSTDGRLLACGTSGRVSVWDESRGECVLDSHLEGVADIEVALSPDGRTLAAAGGSKLLYLFDVESGSLMHSLKGQKLQIWSVAISPDGRTVATGGEDTAVILWDARTGRSRASLLGHTTTVRTVVFTPDGQTLLSGSSNELIRWDTATGSRRETWVKPAQHMALSPDGKVLVHGITQQIQLRDLASGRELGEIRGHKDDIYGIAFSADGKSVATACLDGTARLWHVPTGRLLLTIPSPGGVTWCAAFSPDNRLLAIGSGSGKSGQVALLHAATPEEAANPVRPLPPGKYPKTGLFPVPRSVLASSIEPRDTNAPTHLLDLTAYYNGSLTKGWIPPSAYGTTRERNLEELPHGLQELAGVRFDVRGLIQLAGRSLNDYLAASYPVAVRGIRADVKCHRLHFLHGTGWRVGDGVPIGQYVVHYTDGQTQQIPIIYGENVRDWWHSPNVDPAASQAEVAWTGKNAALRDKETMARVYRFTWENPWPEAVIASIDFISANTSSSPFLIAVTAGP